MILLLPLSALIVSIYAVIATNRLDKQIDRQIEITQERLQILCPHKTYNLIYNIKTTDVVATCTICGYKRLMG